MDITPTAPVVAPLPGFGPVVVQERIETLDIVRGFALLAILLVNWSTDLLWVLEPWAGWTGAPDQLAYWTVQLLLDNKSWPMFSFLFGLGFALQMQRAKDRGVPFVATYVRRLVVLFLIGAAHFILTDRDILWSYAIFGFLLLPLRKLHPKLLVVLALLWLLIPFTRDALIDRDRERTFTSANNARSRIALDPAALDAYVGVYELGPGATFFVTREGDALFGQEVSRGNDWVRVRLAAESPTEFFSTTEFVARYMDLRVSFVKDSTGTVRSILLNHNGQDARGSRIQAGQQGTDDEARRRAANQDEKSRTYGAGTFGQIVSLRARLFWRQLSSFATNYLSWLSDTFALFLLGLYAGRKRIFNDIAAHRPFIRKVMWWGLGLGLAGATFATIMRAPGTPFLGESVPLMLRTVADGSEVFGSPLLGLGYIAALTLLLQHDTWKRRLAPLGAVGRMALTNYLLQSIAFVLLFFGYGLGWYAKVGAFGGVMLALPLFAFQIVASQWWLRRFRFGPAEWLWRTLTYGRRQPMRIELTRAAGEA